ncbi:CDP-Glycerol:Poly(glycerophosphate) glycerophosphotransferase [Marinospirillum celere]|uniref:CDP-Glycerol:Poly(Glycerophosphate) glycerophosphotransferase n=1 Tax=Marinospirillum celere TaxID=1122252 RepID=A0A1I1EAF9_9GAMM|nr:CDP-glycerol glycerophosphotransferase family protein [Marinospirillum celere]SFB84081.1 CDP-Glycerol:Poly(glycerophosphate) glycerophosphotransferase [Marinospirillum celere]
MKSTIWFDTPSLYYIPQYEPVIEELQKRGYKASLLIHQHPAQKQLIDHFCKKTQLPWKLINSKDSAEFYSREKPEWIIFGNNYEPLKQLDKNTKTALLYHGIGIKSCYYDAELAQFDVRFTEGSFRQEQLQTLYPEANFKQTGFAKLDPLGTSNLPYQKAFKPEEHGLDANRPTLVYAPTFYPSSIERMPKNWPNYFSDCNLVIKPHLFSYTNKKYAKQRQLFKHWQTYPNVYLAPAEEISLLPYMATADLLISEASSALFEFAALDKPVIWLDFLKLRWSYRGIFRYRFERRMDMTINDYRDVATHISRPNDLEQIIREELQHPERKKAERLKATQQLIGEVDGKASIRIAGYLTAALSSRR